MSDSRGPDLPQQLGDLPTETEVPPDLEERTVRRLRARGLLAEPGRARQHRATTTPWWALAACLAGALGGWLARGYGTSIAPHPGGDPAGGQRFVLLLSEITPLETAKSRSELVAEYRGWAQHLARQGRLVAAERLIAGARRLGRVGEGPETGVEAVTGLFLVVADDWGEALAVASSCPHLAYGGGITVRRAAGPDDAED